MSESLGTALPAEQARCRALLQQYAGIAKLPQVHVGFAVAMIESALREADEAVMSGDVVRMLRAYDALKGCE